MHKLNWQDHNWSIEILDSQKNLYQEKIFKSLKIQKPPYNNLYHQVYPMIKQNKIFPFNFHSKKT